MEKILDFKNIKFNHDRDNLLTSLYGDLSDAAANIAEEDLESRLDSFASEMDNSEDFKSSKLLEVVLKYANNYQELIYLTFCVASYKSCKN